MPTPFDPSRLNYQLGTYLVGKMGVGKSTALAQIVCHAVEAGWGCCVLDPHGDLVDDLMELIPVERERDVLLVDYRDEERPAGFDIFAGTSLPSPSSRAGYIAKVVDAFKKLWGDSAWGPRMEDLLRVIAITFMENPGTTMRDMERLLIDERFRHKCVRNVQSQTVRTFWEQFDQMTPAGQRQQVDSTMNKVRAFLTNPVLDQIVGQRGKVLDAVQAMRNKEIVLLCLPERVLGEQGVDFLGTLYLSRLRAATQQRMTLPRAERTPFVIALDEFHRFAGPDIPSFLAEARKAGVGLVMAHQWRGQIGEVDIRQAPMAAGNHMVFRVIPEDATNLAREFRYLPNGQELMPRYEVIDWKWLTEHFHSVEASNEMAAIVQVMDELPRYVQEASIRVKRRTEAWYAAKFPEERKPPNFGRDIYGAGAPPGAAWREDVLKHIGYHLYNRMAGEEEGPKSALYWVKHWTMNRDPLPNWGIEPEPVDPEGQRPQRLLDHVRRLGDILKQHPVLLPPEPLLDMDGSKSDIATALMSLPRFHAHCLFDGEEQTITVYPPHHPLMAIDQGVVRERSAARLSSPLPERDPEPEEPVRAGPPKRYG